MLIILNWNIFCQDSVDSGGSKRSYINPGPSGSSPSSSSGGNDKLTDHSELPEIVLTGCSSLEMSACIENAQKKDVKNSMHSAKNNKHDVVGEDMGDPCLRCGSTTVQIIPEQRLCSRSSLPNGETSIQNCDRLRHKTQPPSPAKSLGGAGGHNDLQGLSQNGHQVSNVLEAGSASRGETAAVQAHLPLKRSHSEPAGRCTGSKTRTKQPTDTWKAFKVSLVSNE